MINYYGHEITWIPKIEKKDTPIYMQIADCIEKDIKKGFLKSGFKLSPQRTIAAYLGINHSTITRAYKKCEEKGLIKGIVGKGTFVSNTAGIPEDIILISSGTQNALSIIFCAMFEKEYDDVLIERKMFRKWS